jgi:O-acetyl-ADP-ribose deacetylase (regulator of RNase III)
MGVEPPVRIEVVDGNLLDQRVDAIVNAWNRNVFPWWLLVPQGVSAEIKRRAGTRPFRELRRYGVLPLGAAVVTSAGTLPHRAIIHVAGIGLLWRASRPSIELSVQNAVGEAARHHFQSVAFPLIGAGTGGYPASEVEQIICETLRKLEFAGDVRVVRYRPR